MQLHPPSDSAFTILGEPEVCGRCQSVSRLTNGLCLNCLLKGALAEEEAPSDKEAFKEILATVDSRDGDWHIAEHAIIHEIARGGMGVVYQAREPRSGRVVALKCILACQGEDDHIVARFRREAETAARLDHPNIVPIYQVGETADGFPYYTMKYAAAGSLLQARRPLLEHPRQSVALMVKVARAVQYAHQNGVLHRDLKPGNILLDSHGEPLLTDFGLARCEAASSYLTRSLASFGTPGYIAPEQADGPAANLTPAADIYSLGAILFELLTGRTPFVGENAFAVMKQSAQEPAPKVRRLAPHVDRDLETICDRCLEREPADRYQSAAELADDLQSWFNDKPIRAKAPGPWRQTRRWIRRNRLLATALAALCLIGMASFVWYGHTRRLALAMDERILASRSVVVFPFLDLDSAQDDAASTRQMIDLLSARLQAFGPARVRAADVPGWHKLDELQKTTQALGGRTILTGTVRNVLGRKRISVRLLNPANGDALFVKMLEQPEMEAKPSGTKNDWAEKIYALLTTENWTDVSESDRDPGLQNPKAREFIEAGRRSMSNSYTLADVEQAIPLFTKAITLEPKSSSAHCSLAMAATTRTHFIADPYYLELGKTEARTALELAPTSTNAHRALAAVYFQEGLFDDALEEEMQTLEFGGLIDRIALFLSMVFDVSGRPDRALSWNRIAEKLQSRPGEAATGIGDCYAKLGDDEQAFAAYDRAIELHPEAARGAIGKCRLHLLRGEFEAAREICRDRLRPGELGEMAQVAAQVEFFSRSYAQASELYAKLMKSDEHGGGSFYGAVTYQSALARINQEFGANEEASRLLEAAFTVETEAFKRQPRNPEAAYRLAAVEACLSKSDAALGHLRQAVALGWLDYRSLGRDPRFDSLRANPELKTLIDGLSARVAALRANTPSK